jgi:hypothetical protein
VLTKAQKNKSRRKDFKLLRAYETIKTFVIFEIGARISVSETGAKFKSSTFLKSSEKIIVQLFLQVGYQNDNGLGRRKRKK